MAAALVWDATGEHYYETGVDRGVLWVANDSGTGYEKGVAWNGLTGVNENPEGGDQIEMWADNILYATMHAREKAGGQITAYTYPDEFMACDGSVALKPGLYVGQQKRKSFCFSWRTMIGNDITDEAGYKIHIAYGCSAAPSNRDYSSVNDSPDANEFSWDYECVPVNVTGANPTATVTIDSRDISAAALAAIETALYGSTAADSTILMPDDLAALIQ